MFSEHKFLYIIYGVDKRLRDVTNYCALVGQCDTDTELWLVKCRKIL